MKHPSASNAEAFVMCGASHVLTQSEKHNDYMMRGSEGHAPLASVVNGQVPDPTDRGYEMVRDFPIDLVLSGVTKRRGEAAFAVNVKTRTSRLIGVDIGRNYGKLEKYEVPCTLDVDGEKDQRPYVRDWKFGISASWWQLMVQCMALAYDDPENPLSEVDAGFVFIDGETRGLEYREDARIVSLEEIDAAADRLVGAFDRAVELLEQHNDGKQLPTVEGEWCRYCGAYPYCPSKWSIAKQMLAGYLEEFDPTQIDALSPAVQGALYAKMQGAKKMIDNVMETLKASAERAPLPLPNGKRLVMMRMKGGERLDKPSVFRVLKELGASDDDMASVVKRSADYQQAKEIK